MEHRTIGWSIAALVVGTFGIVAMSAVEKATASRDLGRAKDALYEAKNDLENSSTARSRMLERVAQAKQLKEAKTKATDELSTIEAAITAAGRKQEDLKKVWQGVRDEYEASIGAVRRKLIGSKLAKLDAGGLTLEDVTIRSVADGLVALEHSAGLTKLPAAKLPADIAAILMPDWNPKLVVKTQTGDSAATVRTEVMPEDEPESDIPLPKLPDPIPGGPTNPHTAARIKLEKERTDLALKMDAARGQQRLQSSKYTQLNAQYQNSRMRSKVVTIPPGMEEARKAAEAIGGQIETARQRHNRMTVELKELMEKEAAWTPPAQ